jgi:hypothetical protein
MCEVFPRVASCTYWKYGTGGHPVGLQALCILSLNIVIDKVIFNFLNFNLVKLIFACTIHLSEFTLVDRTKISS